MCVFQKKVCFLKNRMFFLSRVDEALQLTFVILMFLIFLDFAVHTKQSSEFKCKIRFENGGNIAACVIDSKNRRSCKKCRFEKCLSAGMKPNWVTNEIGGF